MKNGKRLLGFFMAMVTVLALGACGNKGADATGESSDADVSTEEEVQEELATGKHHEETIKGEFSENGVENGLSHIRGAISMARARAYDSASSQFFIVHEDSVFLDGQYACFGYVTDGMDVVDAICDAVPVTDGNGTVAAENQPVIESVKVID